MSLANVLHPLHCFVHLRWLAGFKRSSTDTVLVAFLQDHGRDTPKEEEELLLGSLRRSLLVAVEVPGAPVNFFGHCCVGAYL